MNLATLDLIVYLVLAAIVAICLTVGVCAWWAYLKTGDPDPNRWSVRVLLVLASLWDNATWPARGGAAR